MILYILTKYITKLKPYSQKRSIYFQNMTKYDEKVRFKMF